MKFYRFIGFFLLLLLWLSPLHANNKIIFQLNKINSYIVFSETILGVSNRPSGNKLIYDKKYARHKVLKGKRAELKSLYQKIKKSRIYNHPQTVNLISAIHIESSLVQTLNALESRIINNYKISIEKKIIQRYFYLLKFFLPVFEKEIWNSNLTKMKRIKKDLEVLSERINIDQIINKIAHFYHIESKSLRKFYVNLYPIPEGKSFSALRIENTAPVGVIIKNNKLNLEWMLSAVVLHEYCHELYGVNKKKIVKMIASYEPSITKDKNFKKVFDESIQTSISAGFIYSKLTGKLFKGPWYNNTTYDLFSKLMYGEILHYLEKNRKIDDAFIEKSLTLYHQIK